MQPGQTAAWVVSGCVSLLLVGCAGNDAPPPASLAAPAPLTEADKTKQQLEKLQLQLTSPLSPSFVPVLIPKPGAAPELLSASASRTLCGKALAARKGKDGELHGYCIEAYKDGRRVVHQLF